MNISFQKSLAELYADLCMQAREVAVKRESGECVCTWCHTVERLHLHDKRCSVSSLSQNFNCMEETTAARIDAALQFIDTYRALGVSHHG